MPTRSSILRGPCIVQFQSQTFYSDDKGVRIDEVIETFPIPTSRFGKVDERVDRMFHRVTFTPDGRWLSLSYLFPYATATIGSSVFSTDKPLTIWTLDGKKRVYTAGAVTKMPDIMLSPVRTMLGEVEFTCVYAEASDPSTSGSLFTDSSSSYPGDTGWAASDIITQPYALAWGSSPWDAFRAKDGISVKFGLQLEPEVNDWQGLFDMTFQGLEVTAELQPETVTPQDVSTALKMQGSGAARGRSLASGSSNLNITGTGVYVRLYNANIKAGSQLNNSKDRRVQPVTFVATRTVTAGAADPLFYVGTSAPA